MSTEADEKRITERIAVEMLGKLRTTSQKEHWLRDSLPSLTMKLKREVQELEEALMDYYLHSSTKNFKHVVDECTDVANFAAMILDNIAFFRMSAKMKEASKTIEQVTTKLEEER